VVAAVLGLALTCGSAVGQVSVPGSLPNASAPTIETPTESSFGLPVPSVAPRNDDGPLRYRTESFKTVESSAEQKRAESRFVQAKVDAQLSLEVTLGRPQLLQLTQTPRRIFVPDDDIIRAEIIDRESGRELAVTGLQPGVTTLILWFEDESQKSGQSIISYLVRVDNGRKSIDDVERQVNQKFPNSFVELSDVNGRLMVSGQANDAIELAQILQVLIAARGIAPGIGRVAPIQPAASVITASSLGQLDLEAQEAEDRSLIDPVALAQAGIINLMRVPGEQQVMLRVTVAEVNRSAARSVGLNFTAISNGNLFSNTTGNVTGNIRALLDGGDISLRIEALRRLSLSRTLAEPNLVAINGQPANFQAGGQFPIPVISAGGAAQNLQGVQFVPFGVQLQFVPIIRDRDVIRLQISADVSTRDEALGTNIGGGGGGGGTAVPGLNSRNFSSTVELRSGQTLAVAGLLQTNFGASSDRIPFLGDLPFFGGLAGTNRTSAAEQELVILVTPEIVAPIDSCALPGLPGNDVYEPTDIEFFLSNRLESRRSRDFRSAVRTDFHKLKRAEQCCVDQFIVGASGPTDRCCNQGHPLQPSMIPQFDPAKTTASPNSELMYDEVIR
jgi:pilus assembly protein CpaC